MLSILIILCRLTCFPRYRWHPCNPLEIYLDSFSQIYRILTHQMDDLFRHLLQRSSIRYVSLQSYCSPGESLTFYLWNGRVAAIISLSSSSSVILNQDLPVILVLTLKAQINQVVKQQILNQLQKQVVIYYVN